MVQEQFYILSIRIHQPNRIPDAVGIRRQRRVFVRHRVHTEPTSHQFMLQYLAISEQVLFSYPLCKASKQPLSLFVIWDLSSLGY